MEFEYYTVCILVRWYIKELGLLCKWPVYCCYNGASVSTLFLYPNWENMKMCYKKMSGRHFSVLRASSRGCRWRGLTRPQTEVQSHIGGRWWRPPGRGYAPPWRWCGCSHRRRPRCSTPPMRHPPTLSWWERPLRGPPAAGRQPLTGPAALHREREIEGAVAGTLLQTQADH